jgi:hypothetical protein
MIITSYQNVLEYSIRMSNLQISTLNELFQQITEKLQEGQSLESLEYIVKSYIGDDWKDYVMFSDNTYQRNKILQNNIAELVVISWKENQKTVIHDHPEGGCILKIVSGSLLEDSYLENEKIWLNTKCLESQDVAFSIGKQILHQIKALSDCVSIHIYSPPNYIPNVYG